MQRRLKKLKNPMIRSSLISMAHKNKIPTAMPMFSGMAFSLAIIFTSPGIADTPEINMASTPADNHWKLFQFGKCYSHPSDVTL